MADDIVVDIAFKGNASDFLAELSRAVGRAKTQLQEMGQSAAAFSRLENVLARASATAGQFAGNATRAGAAMQGWSQKWVPFKGQFLEGEAASKAMWKSIDTGLADAERSLNRGVTAAQKFQDTQARTAAQAARKAPMADWDKQFEALSRAADINTAKMQQARRAVEEYQNSLSNARYVLYDVAGTLTILGAGLVTPLAASVAVAAEFEKQFAQVARTSGLVGSELEKLKGDFDSLYGSIPITYEALAKIATLAGQLGVPADRIAAFTETVAKTAAVTDLTVEQAATAFGRLDALIPNVRGQYDRLGSSIAKVGVNSVATESEIVNISTQISSMGAFAGLTAQDIIGLSGALASIGAQPELSRGTVTRVFTLMSRAVSTGGESLEKFAALSGVSAEQFRSSWGTDRFAGTFIKFMDGIKSRGGDAVAALNELGITSVRDVPLLLRLANAADSTGQAGKLLAQTIGDANSGWAENIELQRQYEIIAATVAAKVEVLSNKFNLLLQAIGAPLLGGIGDLVDLLGELTDGATDFAKSDIGGIIVRITIVLAALLGVLALAGGAMALFGASSIGVYQALVFLTAQSPLAASAILGTSGAAAVADGSLKAGAASAVAFGRALKALSLIGLALVLPDILTQGGNAIADQVDKITGATRNWDTALGRLAEKTAFFGQSGFDIKSNPLANFFLTVPWDQTTRDLQFLNDEMERLADVGDFSAVADSLTAISKASGYKLDEIIGGSDLEKKLDAAQVKLIQLHDGTVLVKGGAESAAGAGDQMAGSLEDIEANAEAAQGALDELKTALDAIGGTQMSAAAAADALQGSINQAVAAISEGTATLYGADDASIGLRDTFRDIETKARDAGAAIAENGGTTEEAIAAWQYGRDSIINMRVAMGESREEAILWADQNYGSAQQVQAGIEGVTAAVNNVPTYKNITLVADTSPAQAAINSFIWSNDGRRINLYVDTYDGRQVAGGANRNLDVARAGGGSVWGAGTATSDSIMARLSNGEFVIRTQAAKAIGYGRLDHMNRYGKMPAFAGGGQVGRQGAGSIMGGVFDLGPRSLRALSRQVINQISIDNQAIAASSRSGNANRAWRGGA